MTHEFHLLIDGAERAGSTGEGGPVVDPATGEVLGEVAYASGALLRLHRDLGASPIPDIDTNPGRRIAAS